MKKVLIVMEGFKNGGVEKALSDYLCRADLNDISLEIHCLTKTYYNLELPENIKITYSNDCVMNFFTPIKESISFYLKNKKIKYIFRRVLLALFSKLNYQKVTTYAWKCIKSLFQKDINKKYDVAIAFKDGLSWYYVYKYIDANKKYAWNHVSYDFLKSDEKYDKHILESYNKVFCVSKTNYRILCDKFMFDSKFEILYNYMDNKEILLKSNNTLEKASFDDNVTNIVTVGRLAPEKGYELILKCCSLLKEKKEDFKWYIIGDGKDYKKMKKYIKNKSLEKFVILVGSVDNPYPYMKNCTLYVQPSITEGYGLTLAEAKILSKRIIATTIPQFVEQDDGYISYINYNVYELLNKIENYLDLVPERKSNYSKNEETLSKFNNILKGNL